MKQRLRNYISVVTALSLCLGLWFGTGQVIKAEGTQQGTLSIQIMDDSSTQEVAISIENFKYSEDDSSCTGTFSLTKEQIKCGDGKYLLYWYKDASKSEEVSKGSLTFNLSDLPKENISVETGDGILVTIKLYAAKGAAHTAVYRSNNGKNKEYSKVFYQDSINTTEGTYDHPQTPTFDGETWSYAGYQFQGWGMDVGSGNVETASDTFYYGIMDSAQEILALWTEINSISSGETYNLASGKSYSLSSGRWIVNDGADNCVYTGETEFYVDEGKYRFTTQ